MSEIWLYLTRRGGKVQRQLDGLLVLFNRDGHRRIIDRDGRQGFPGRIRRFTILIAPLHWDGTKNLAARNNEIAILIHGQGNRYVRFSFLGLFHPAFLFLNFCLGLRWPVPR